jgi:hypothetical protein
MADTRKKNVNWQLPERLVTWDQVNTALLMDIRDELQQLNSVFACRNAQEIPALLRMIKKNTSPKKAKKP